MKFKNLNTMVPDMENNYYFVIRKIATIDVDKEQFMKYLENIENTLAYLFGEAKIIDYDMEVFSTQVEHYSILISIPKQQILWSLIYFYCFLHLINVEDIYLFGQNTNPVFPEEWKNYANVEYTIPEKEIEALYEKIIVAIKMTQNKNPKITEEDLINYDQAEADIEAMKKREYDIKKNLSIYAPIPKEFFQREIFSFMFSVFSETPLYLSMEESLKEYDLSGLALGVTQDISVDEELEIFSILLKIRNLFVTNKSRIAEFNSYFETDLFKKDLEKLKPLFSGSKEYKNIQTLHKKKKEASLIEDKDFAKEESMDFCDKMIKNNQMTTLEKSLEFFYALSTLK